MELGGVDVVIVNHRTPTDLAHSLAAVGAHAPEQSTVWIVNVMPEPRDGEVAETWCRPRARWHHLVHEDNCGWNRACNHAAGYGDAEFVAFLNADASPMRETFGSLLGALVENPTWGVIGPRQVDSKGLLTAAGIIGPPDSPRHRGWHEADRGQYNDILTDVVMVAGSFVIMRRSALDELTACPIYQRFAEGETGPWGSFAHYAGDAWLGRHARAHDWGVTFYGPAKARHEWHRSSRIGGYGEQMHERDRQLLRTMCAAHDLACN